MHGSALATTPLLFYSEYHNHVSSLSPVIPLTILNFWLVWNQSYPCFSRKFWVTHYAAVSLSLFKLRWCLFGLANELLWSAAMACAIKEALPLFFAHAVIWNMEPYAFRRNINLTNAEIISWGVFVDSQRVRFIWLLSIPWSHAACRAPFSSWWALSSYRGTIPCLLSSLGSCSTAIYSLLIMFLCSCTMLGCEWQIYG